MSRFVKFATALNLALLSVFAAEVSLAGDEKRVVTVGGSLTEIVYALGQENRLIARDTTSSFPPQVLNLPDIGYARALSPEGVLSVSPDLIIAIEGAGPPETLDVLKAADVTYVSVPEAYTAEGIRTKILTVGKALGQDTSAAVLAAKAMAELSEARQTAAQAAMQYSKPKKVLFVLSTAGGRIMAGGDNTAAAGIIALAGGVNAAAGFDGYKPMTDEAIAVAAPDVILMMERSGDHDTAPQDLLALPAIAPTPAAEAGAVIRMDGLKLLGFGPRTATAVSDLATALYGTGS
ncbi:heme/hemin ABC transporter substrate-binding protein [Phaeobacter porticola]|uniref:ABC-type hemin transport system, periplasmic component n=1 Tax=Phaeobacter porticola TaxID=1844006 RepID=A0A1L3IAE3_9RHOB|nr:ABC transporter substrate-binding protein [Phaeobacter porticola]APG49075.1 ABC-type hemin transport system, periplasmic component [Phaeobacter porticola]